MRLPREAHSAQPWLIHEIAPDFRLEDVWALPAHGGRHDFPRLVEAFDTLPFPERAPAPVRALWAARWRLGRWFGWDDPSSAVGARVPSLRERLPAGVEAPVDDGALPGTPFATVYVRPGEYAAELANETVHAVLHLGWVDDGAGTGHRGQLAVLVKPHGRRGALYLAAIKPLRLALVYPALLRLLDLRWRELQDERAR
jgi:hypothetical protein